MPRLWFSVTGIAHIRPFLCATLFGLLAWVFALPAGATSVPLLDTTTLAGRPLAPEAIDLTPDRLRIDLGHRVLEAKPAAPHRHANGDLSLELRPVGGDAGLGGQLTIGGAGVYGLLHSGSGRHLLTTDADGTRWIDLPETGVEYNRCGLDHGPGGAQITHGHGHPPGKGPGTAAPRPMRLPAPPSTQATDVSTVLDLLLIYNEAFAQRYPGELLATRLNHLVDITNRTLANSGLDAGVRLVGAEPVGYRNDNSNLAFRNDITQALRGASVPGLEGLRILRDDLAADLVIGLRPHDIDVRGSCGIAFFPDDDASLGVNVVSDGVSSWSFCLDDVLTHEIGHNLGATHQLGAGGGVVDPLGSAFVRPGRFTTVMGSFGTGRPDRFRGLAMFSNPSLPCGNEACGNAIDTDNAAVMRSFLPAVAAYRTAVSARPVPQAREREASDQDADGVTDWFDALPFDATETADADGDGRGDISDAFPLDPLEQDDTDGDGVGNVADPDDDGDGTADQTDAFPLDPAEQGDADRDGVGDAADGFPTDADEFRDTDGDGLGDNADRDDDDDGFPEFDTLRQDLLVISVNEGQILRFDAASGAPRGVEVPAWDSRITFQSRMNWRRSDDTLFFTGNSGLRRLDLLDRSLLGEWVPPFDVDHPSAVQLGSGFPVGLASIDGGRRILVARLGSPELGIFQGAEQARGLPASNGFLGEEESAGTMTSDGTTAYVLGLETRSIYRIDNVGPRPLAGPGLGWMRDPRYMALSGDGRLLVSDQARNSVVALNRDNGAFLGDLVRFDDLGFDEPAGLAVTDEGTLLVGAGGQDAILAFDAQSGAFEGVRVQGSGLDRPGDLLLVPALDDRFGRDPERLLRPNAGLWSAAASNGRGFDIQVFGSRISVIWYSYDDRGDPTWTLAVGDLVADRFEAPLRRFTLPGGDQTGTAVNEIVGSIALRFESERRAQVAWLIDGIAGEEDLDWLVFTPRLRRPDVTGLWGREDGPGWGISLANQGGITVAIAYLFDAEGNPRWALSDRAEGPGPFDFDLSAVFAPGLCPGCDGDGGFTLVPAGTMSLSVAEAARWSSDLTWPAPLAGRWRIDETPIRRFSAEPERPR